MYNELGRIATEIIFNENLKKGRKHLNISVCLISSKISHQLSKDHKVLKLGDFGLARATIGSKSRKTETGSYRYMAPEVMISEGKYSEKSDVYSFGEYGLLW